MGGIAGRRVSRVLVLLLAPVADGREGTPALFDDDDATRRRLVLESVERRASDMLWLRYRVERVDRPA